MISTCSVSRTESSSHSNPTLISCVTGTVPTEGHATLANVHGMGTRNMAFKSFRILRCGYEHSVRRLVLQPLWLCANRQSAEFSTQHFGDSIHCLCSRRLGCSTAGNSNSKCTWWWHCCRTYCRSWWPHGGGIRVKKENCWRSWGGKLLLNYYFDLNLFFKHWRKLKPIKWNFLSCTLKSYLMKYV